MKKILFVTYDFPYPTNTGGKNRAYNMLKHSGKEFDKYLFSFVRSDFKDEYTREMEKIDVKTVGIRKRKKVTNPKNLIGLLSGNSIFKTLYFSKKILADLLQIVRRYEIDVIHFESFYTGFYISEQFKKLGIAQIYGSENIEFKLYEDYAAKASIILRPLYNLQVDKIKAEEMEMYRLADITLAVTDGEASFIRKFTTECEIIRNGVDIDELSYNKPRARAKTLLFVGNFSYFPNTEAIESFYKNIFTKLSPDVKLRIVGKKVSALKFIKDTRVEAIEFVPDIKDVYRDVDIFISPVRIGGGTNFKILEAMASGLPIIAYEKRLEAVGVEDDKHVLVARDDNDFKNKIEYLFESFKLRQKLAQNARKFVEEKYSWKVIGYNLGNVWRNL